MASRPVSIAQAVEEQRTRWCAGDPIEIEELMEIVDSPDRHELILDLIYNEVLLREAFGHFPAPEEYEGRFPEVRVQISKQFQIHRATKESPEDRKRKLSAIPESPTPPEIPGFEILDLLGRGGSGVAWKAHDLALGRDVAIKIVGAGLAADDTARALFKREAESVASLSHPAIVPIHQVGECSNMPFFVLGFVDGCPLASKLRDGPLSPKEAARMMSRIANAIQYAHDQRIIHRDLKPANILLDKDGIPFVCDFGLSRKIGAENTLQTSGQVVGTPAYMPPEQAMGGKSDELSDLYSLGVILYEMLSGHSPFQSVTPLESMHRVMNDRAVPLLQLDSSLPKDLETICQKCMEKSPSARYQSVAEFEAELNRFLDGEPIVARPIGSIARLARWCRREPRTAGLIGLASTLAIGMTVAVTYAAIKIREANSRSDEAIETAIVAKVDTLTSTAPEAVPFAIKSLDLDSPRTIQLLQEKIYDKSLDASARLHAAYALARSEFDPKLVAGFISELPLRAGSCKNIVKFFDEHKSELSKECVARAQSGGVDSRFRFSMVALFLGDSGPAAKLANPGADPASRTVLIHKLKDWHGGLDVLAELLAKPIDPDLKSALCIATGRIDPRLVNAEVRKAVSESMSQIYAQSLRGGVHNAARWAMHQWEIPLPKLEASEPAENVNWHITDSGLTMIRIPGETFTMGSKDQRLSMPIHTVTLEADFWMSDREISLDLFKQYMASVKENGEQAWEADSVISPTDDCPAQNMTWIEAVGFCNWLSEQEGRDKAYSKIAVEKQDDQDASSINGWRCDFDSTGYRLPTDAEWEFAARCGSAGRYSFGFDPSIVAMHVRSSNRLKIAALPCGSLIPNQFGLLDMEGNVWEWTWDEFVQGTDKDFPGPYGPDLGIAKDLSKQRVIRGGGVDNGSGDSCLESRGNCSPQTRAWNLGLRVVRTAE